jgi:hypothetical protein
MKNQDKKVPYVWREQEEELLLKKALECFGKNLQSLKKMNAGENLL